MSQKEAASRLGVSQPYLSQLENGKRVVPSHLARRVQRLYDLPATWLPLDEKKNQMPQVSGDALARLLAGLGYPGFSYVKNAHPKNPAEVLLNALKARNLDGRLVEALPWIPLSFPGLNWQWLRDEAKKHEVQNRLGYVINVARNVAELRGQFEIATKLSVQEKNLESARLLREDTLCQESMTETERQWLLENRPPEARYWRVISDLLAAHLSYAA